MGYAPAWACISLAVLILRGYWSYLLVVRISGEYAPYFYVRIYEPKPMNRPNPVYSTGVESKKENVNQRKPAFHYFLLFIQIFSKMKLRKINIFSVGLMAVLMSFVSLYSQNYVPDPKDGSGFPDKSVGDLCTNCSGLVSNYVCNPSFDSYSDILSSGNCQNRLGRATGWGNALRTANASSEHAGTPDLWYPTQVDPANSGVQGYSTQCGLWRNGNNTPFGSQVDLQLPGFTDGSYIGVGNYISPALFDSIQDPQTLPTRESREYVVTQLKQPLKPNTTYTISMYVSLGEISTHASPLQVLVSNRYWFGLPTLGPKPYYALKSNLTPTETANLRTLTTGVTDKDGWTKVTVTFNPGNSTDLQYLIIGYFEHDNVADVQCTPVAASPNPPGYTYRQSHSSYYFIDHVSITECTAPLVLGQCGEPLLYSQVASLINANNDMLIDGQLVMDVNAILNNKNISFTVNGAMAINSGIQFSLRNSYLHGCNNMWVGIGCVANSRIELDNTTVEDAYTALYLDGVQEFNIKNCTFDLNETAVTIRNHTANYLRQITGTKFKASAACKDPNIGLPKTGVRVVNTIVAPNIGQYFSTLNIFSDLKTGVLAEKSNVSIKNNNFNNIGQDLGGWSIELNNPHEQGNTPLYTAYIGGLNNSNERNLFYDCDKGMQALGHWKTEIYGNQFVNIDGIAISLMGGFRAINNQTSHHVRQNSIQKVRTGVNIEGQGLTSAYRVERNTMSNIGSSVSGSIGVRVFDKTGRVGKCSPSVVHYVDSNSIMRFDWGVDMEGGECSNIRWNKVLTVVAPGENVERTGIRYRNSSGVNVLKNEVEGTSTDYYVRSIGIRGENVSLSDCGCNKVTMTHVALYTGLSNPAMRVFNNDVKNAKDGLLINFGSLGNQAFDRNNPNTTLEPINTFVGMVPRVGFPQGVEAYANNCPPNHTKYFGTIIRAAQGPQIDLGIPSNNDPSLLRNLCLYLKKKSDSTAYIPTMEALFMEPKIEGGIYDETHQFLQDKVLFEAHLQDETLKDNSTIIGTRIQAIKSKPGALWAEIYMRIDTGNYEGAGLLLGSVSPASDIEQLNAQFAPIYLRYMMQGAGALDDADHATLANIAEQCFVEYGYVVSMSRSLLLHVWDVEVTLPTCDRIEEPTDLLPEAEEPGEGGFFTLSPNPATTQVNLYSNFMETCSYTVLNGLGNTVLTGIANHGDNFIGITNFTPGQYHVRLTFNGELLEDKILVVE